MPLLLRFNTPKLNKITLNLPKPHPIDIINCYCGITHDDDVRPMMQCNGIGCEKWSHAGCVGADSMWGHFCHVCHPDRYIKSVKKIKLCAIEEEKPGRTIWRKSCGRCKKGAHNARTCEKGKSKADRVDRLGRTRGAKMKEKVGRLGMRVKVETTLQTTKSQIQEGDVIETTLYHRGLLELLEGKENKC